MDFRIGDDVQASDDLRLLIEFDVTPAESDADELVALVADWVALGARGGFVVADAMPATSHIQARNLHRRGADFAWELRCQRVDRRAFRVLRNALVGYERIVAPIRAVAVAAQRGGAVLMPLSVDSAAAIGEGYPALSKHLSLSVVRMGRNVSGASRRTLIRFSAPPGAELARALQQAIEAWAMVVFCGYPQSDADLDSGSCAIFNSDVEEVDDTTWALIVDDFGGVEDAWNPLINLCDALSTMPERVVAIDIE